MTGAERVFLMIWGIKVLGFFGGGGWEASCPRSSVGFLVLVSCDLPPCQIWPFINRSGNGGGSGGYADHRGLLQKLHKAAASPEPLWRYGILRSLADICLVKYEIWAVWWKHKSRLHINQELNSSFNDGLQKAALTKKCFVSEICLACKKRATFLRARSLIHPCPRYYPFCCFAYLSILSAISQLFTILPSGCFHLSSGRPGSPIVSQPFPPQIRIHLRRKLTCQIETGVHYKSPVTQTTWEVARKRHTLYCVLVGVIWTG